MLQLSSQMNHREHKTPYGRFVWGSVHWNEYISVYVCSHLFLPSYRSISSSIWFYQLLSFRSIFLRQFSWHFLILFDNFTAWKVSKYGFFSGPYFSVFSLNTGKYGPEKTPYLDTFHAVKLSHIILVSLSQSKQNK